MTLNIKILLKRHLLGTGNNLIPIKFILLVFGGTVFWPIAWGVSEETTVLAQPVNPSPQLLAPESPSGEATRDLSSTFVELYPYSSLIPSTSCSLSSSQSCNESLEFLSFGSSLVSRSQEKPDRTLAELDDNISQLQQLEEKQSPPQKPTPSPSPTGTGSESPDAEVDPDLGRLRLRERKVPPRQPQPVLHVVPRISYFYTNNVFSGVDPVEDSLYFPSLTIWSTPKLGPRTYLTASVDGNLIRYLNQSEYDYNLLRFRTGIYQRLTSRMGGEIGWNNQQYFRASTGDRFLSEHFIYLNLSRRDWLTKRLALDSFYDVRLSFADPDNRSRLSNYLSVSLSYYFQRNLQVGMNYQFSFSDFTKRDREDYYHRLLGSLTYGINKTNQINLQGGVTVGGSTESNIDFDSLFFSVTYSVDLQVF